MLCEHLLPVGLAGPRLTLFSERRRVKPENLMNQVTNRADAFDT